MLRYKDTYVSSKVINSRAGMI